MSPYSSQATDPEAFYFIDAGANKKNGMLCRRSSDLATGPAVIRVGAFRRTVSQLRIHVAECGATANPFGEYSLGVWREQFCPFLLRFDAALGAF